MASWTREKKPGTPEQKPAVPGNKKLGGSSSWFPGILLYSVRSEETAWAGFFFGVCFGESVTPETIKLDPETKKLAGSGLGIYESVTPETIKLDPETKKLDPETIKLERSGPDFGSIWGRLPVFRANTKRRMS